MDGIKSVFIRRLQASEEERRKQQNDHTDAVGGISNDYEEACVLDDFEARYQSLDEQDGNDGTRGNGAQRLEDSKSEFAKRMQAAEDQKASAVSSNGASSDYEEDDYLLYDFVSRYQSLDPHQDEGGTRGK